MSDLAVADDGTISEADAGALEQAVRERLEELLWAKPRAVEFVTITVGFQEPPA